MTVAGELWGVAWGLYALNLAYFGATVFYVRVKVREQPKWPPELAGAWMRPQRLVIARVGVVEVVMAALFGVLIVLIA